MPKRKENQQTRIQEQPSKHQDPMQKLSQITSKMPSFPLKRTENSLSDQKTGNDKAYVQDILEGLIKDIVGGMILMANGSVVCIQEFLPLNFYQRPLEEQNEIIENFETFFRAAPDFLHLKMFTSKADVNKLIGYINSVNQNEVDKKILRETQEYIEYIRNLQTLNSVHRRYFIIWEYEGDQNGNKSTDINEIYRNMWETRNYIKERMHDLGNLSFDPVSNDDNNWFYSETLYQILNPYSSIMEPFVSRVNRLISDQKKYNASVNLKHPKKYSNVDYLAPRGIQDKSNYLIVDGQYYTYLALRDIGHPKLVYGGWTNLLSKGIGYDIDILIKKLPHELVISYLKYNNRFNESYAILNAGKREKYQDLMGKLQNRTYIQDMMNQNRDDLYSVMIIMTIRADSYKNMMYKKNQLERELKKDAMYTVDAFQVALEYYKMTLPLNYINNRLFKKNNRNYLSSSLGSLYNMTGNELFNDSGFVVGVESGNSSLVSFNPFDTSIYNNANIAIFGASGAGKTFLECMFARRARLSGRRVYMVLPVKGSEYAGLANCISGTFVKLHPGSRDCINLMQIRPVKKINKNFLDENTKYEETSLLAKKITFIETFIASRLGDRTLDKGTLAKLNSIITEIYGRFGITHDNDSIYRDKRKTILKDMPIIEDLYNSLDRYEDLHYIVDALSLFVDGTFSNLNGQTNIDLNNNCVVFDVDSRIVGPDDLPSVMLLASDFCMDMIMQDDLSQDFLIIDEAWAAMVNDLCAKKVQEIVKLIRGYGGSLVIATQEADDYVDQIKRYGNSIMTNTAIKIVLRTNKKELNIVSDYVELSEADRKTLLNLVPKKQGMIFSPADRIKVNFEASDHEIEIFTTDINVKQKINKRKMREQKQREAKNISV